VKEGKRVLISGLCPHCQSEQIRKGGKPKAGKQRSKCHNAAGSHDALQRNLIDNGRFPASKAQSVDLALNGSGIRDAARVVQLSPTTIIDARKKKRRHAAG
jgi:transposase-like protein